MGCYYGMNSGRGAQGVGRATKSSVQAAAAVPHPRRQLRPHIAVLRLMITFDNVP